MSDNKVRSIKDLLSIKEGVMRKNALRDDGYHACITVHMGTCGIASGARDILQALMEMTEKHGEQNLRLTSSGCVGACFAEPVMTVERLDEPPVLYGNLTSAAACQIFNQHVLAGDVVTQYVITLGDSGKQEVRS